jgi:hypothetical protein
VLMIVLMCWCVVFVKFGMNTNTGNRTAWTQHKTDSNNANTNTLTFLTNFSQSLMITKETFLMSRDRQQKEEKIVKETIWGIKGKAKSLCKI